MNSDDLSGELRRLSQRLDRIERWIGMPAPSETESPPAAEPSLDQQTVRAAIPPVIVSPTIDETPQPPPELVELDVSHETTGRLAATLARLAQTEPPKASSNSAVVPEPEPPRVWARPPFADEPERSRGSFEQFVGGKIMAWVGALAVIVAVGFFIKLAYDQGWLGRLTPTVRCVAAAAFGLILLGAGEWALRRIGRTAAVGLFGAGLGTLYLTTYAAYHFFTLLTQVEAFVLLALVALAGFGLTIRGQMLVIGILSVLGGYLSPVLLAGHAASPVALPLYLTMLLGISLSLATSRMTFIPLRYLALVAHGVIGTGWIANEAAQHPPLSMVFLSIWWCMVAAEAVRAARRSRTPIGNVACTLLGTFWYVTAGCWVLSQMHAHSSHGLGLFTFAVAVISIALTYFFGTGHAALRPPLKVPIARLSFAFWVQAGILHATSVGLYFDDFGQTVGWLATAVGCIEIGRRLRSRPLDAFGLIVGMLAVGRLINIDAGLPSLQTRIISWPQFVITRWSVLALIAIAATHLAGRRIRSGRRDGWRMVPAVLALLGTLGWFAWCMKQASDVTITAGWLIGCILLTAFERAGRRQHYMEIGLLGLIATAGRWLVFDSLIPRFEPGWNPNAHLPLLNAQMGMASAIAFHGGWATKVLRRRSAGESRRLFGSTVPTVWQCAFISCFVFLMIGLSFEVDRAVVAASARGTPLSWSTDQLRLLCLTMLWCIGALAIGLIATGAGRIGSQVAPILAKCAWVLIVLCGLKFVAVDTLFALIWSEAPRFNGEPPLPVANVQTLTAFVLAVSAVLLAQRMSFFSHCSNLADEQPDASPRAFSKLANLLPVAVALLLLWSLSFEVDRLLGRLTAHGWSTPWPPLELRALWWTLLWAAGGLSMVVIGRWRRIPSLPPGGAIVLFTATIAWLSLDTLGWRLACGLVLTDVVLNLQFMSGAALALMLSLLMRWAKQSSAFPAPRASDVIKSAFTAILAIGLWLGTLELDRFFAPQAARFNHAELARQTGFSVYWGIYGIGLVALGFARRIARCRHAALALLSVTLAKVLLVDLAGVGYVYRVLSLLAVGLLLVVTSVAYARLGPRFLIEQPDQ